MIYPLSTGLVEKAASREERLKEEPATTRLATSVRAPFTPVDRCKAGKKIGSYKTGMQEFRNEAPIPNGCEAAECNKLYTPDRSGNPFGCVPAKGAHKRLERIAGTRTALNEKSAGPKH